MLVLQAEPHQSCEEALVVVTNLLPPLIRGGNPRDAVSRLTVAVRTILENRAQLQRGRRPAVFLGRSTFEFFVGVALPKIFENYFKRSAGISRVGNGVDGPFAVLSALAHITASRSVYPGDGSAPKSPPSRNCLCGTATVIEWIPIALWCSGEGPPCIRHLSLFGLLSPMTSLVLTPPPREGAGHVRGPNTRRAIIGPHLKKGLLHLGHRF
jgi:hypothetical protein